LVVGKQEETSKSVNIRTRDHGQQGSASIDEIIHQFAELQANKSRDR